MELRNLATLIRTADVLCCQERIGFYLTAQGTEITEEMMDLLGIQPEQIDEIRANLPEKLAATESALAAT